MCNINLFGFNAYSVNSTLLNRAKLLSKPNRFSTFSSHLRGKDLTRKSFVQNSNCNCRLKLKTKLLCIGERVNSCHTY